MCLLDAAKVTKRNQGAKDRLVVVRAIRRAPLQTKLGVTEGFSTDSLMARTPLHCGLQDGTNTGALAIMAQATETHIAACDCPISRV